LTAEELNPADDRNLDMAKKPYGEVKSKAESFDRVENLEKKKKADHND